ncbi:MAG: Periplasmic pH-dependent serine endoprotease DegQ [Chlamydiae bacterium]|nr:Periplasmic pH-dependent serine endoprotease DegQ [Chlamydiota bacterium]
MRFLICLLLATISLTAKDDGCCSPEHISKTFTTVAKEAIPAVVFIKVQGAAEEETAVENRQNPNDMFGDDFFNRFFGTQPRRTQKQPQQSQGSGFLITSDGYIMTNAHVVKEADKMTAVLHDGREMDAILVGLDTSTDVAVIKIEGADFPFIELGNSDEMEIGEWVVAIGSPFQLEASLTVGVISAKGRQNLRITDLEDFIQTDAAINPGNSGGPLINLKNEVIGINTAIVSRSGGYMGIGFAIPSNMAKHIMEQIIENGSVSRGFLGVSLQPVDRDIADAFDLKKAEGALVSEVVKDSPAEKGGLQQGDIILAFNGKPVKSVGAFRKEISMTQPGTIIKLKVRRGGKTTTLSITLGSHGETMAGSSGIMQKLGMEVESLTPQLAAQLGYNRSEEGIVITKVRPGSAAATAGIRPGFLILAINHKKVTTLQGFNDALKEPTAKNRVLILVKQGSVTRFYSVKIE